MQILSLIEVEQSFNEYLSFINHPVNHEIKFDTSDWQRYDCQYASKGNLNVSYKAHSDKKPCLKIKCHKCHSETMMFKYDGNFQLAPFQRQNLLLEINKKKNSTITTREATLKAMQTEWNNTKPCTNHLYFNRKDLFITESDGLRIDNQGRILCPIKLITGDLISTQSISYKGKKLFYKNTSPKNGFHIIGALEDSTEAFLAEGIATAVSIRDSVHKPVICVYGKHFSDIAPIIKNNYPAIKLTYCCDLPSKNELVTSENNAKRTMINIGGTYALPDFSMIPNKLRPDIKRSDFNDLLVLLIANGLNRSAALNIVRQQIQQC